MKWAWAKSRDNWLTATHIPGKLNVEADRESRETETRTEWMLNREIIRKTVDVLNFEPKIDLFATRLNNQFDQFVSPRLDLLQLPQKQTRHRRLFTKCWDSK